ncbi:hypothetical protein [Fictibacillus arsenicus]|uniref:DUF2007 domain-containing protein n=1 Tax=Fictibacillus arsenicus TaxID=255247 RepID=A0A1V3G9J7_9BACL|nr:hypothetical protein [Fictibacillus arsenicus]OOE13079.1 hypothetical protein UN64_13680 [Fictibacillus arsenicus]
MSWFKKSPLYLVHLTISPGESFKAQQLLSTWGIPFKLEMSSSCILLKVKEEDIELAKNVVKFACIKTGDV